MHPSLFALAVPWESGAAHRQAMARLSQTTLCGILLRDRDGGRVRVDRAGNPIVRYRLSRYDARHLRRAFAAPGELLEAAGAKEISLPLARRAAYRPGPGAPGRWLAELDRVGSGPNQMLPVQFHQLASCRIGANAKTSVGDARHPVWNGPGPYG